MTGETILLQSDCWKEKNLKSGNIGNIGNFEYEFRPNLNQSFYRLCENETNRFSIFICLKQFCIYYLHNPSLC